MNSSIIHDGNKKNKEVTFKHFMDIINQYFALKYSENSLNFNSKKGSNVRFHETRLV